MDKEVCYIIEWKEIRKKGITMENLQNLHTHSTFCDGADTPEEIIISALEQGFSSIGFSGHSYMPFNSKMSMSEEGTSQYKKEINSLKEKYKDKLDIFCGIEFEMFSTDDLSGYDYIIGDAHYLKINGEYIGFDRDVQTVKGIIDTYFGGNGLLYAKAYYETLSQLPDIAPRKVDIVGHFDIVTKHIEKENFFDTESREYKRFALEALHALAERIELFEINTGAVSRGYRTSPYPQSFILKELKSLNKGIVISSDCHNKNHLTQSFDEAALLARNAGFKERYVLTQNGFKAVGL